MSHARAVLRILALTLWTAAALVVLATGSAARHVAGRPTPPWKGRVLRRWASGACRLVGMRVRVEGRAPAPPFVLVANHLSYVDVLLLAARVPSAVFVARADLARWPVLGFLSRSVDTLYTDRSDRRDLPRAVATMREALAAGRGVVLFPEGTSTGGSNVLPFKSSLLETAVQAGAPCWHAALLHATPPSSAPARLAVCWWGDMTFGRHLYDLLRLPGFDSLLVFGAEPTRAGDRKVLASTLHAAVSRDFAGLAS